MNETLRTDDPRPWQREMRAVLQATYPNGVPPEDYEPLVYVLSDRSTDADGNNRKSNDSPHGQHIAGLSPSVEIFAMLHCQIHPPLRDATITEPVRLIGVDLATRSDVGSFGEFILNKDGQHIQPTFDMDEAALKRFNMQFMPPWPDAAPPAALADPSQPPPPDAWTARPTK